LAKTGTHPHALSPETFAGLFGKDVPVVFNFHGYPAHLKSLIFSRSDLGDHRKIEVLGYIEQGTTTTPWLMLRMNKAGRFDVAAKAIGLVAKHAPNSAIAARSHEIISGYLHKNAVQEKYALEHGEDSPEVSSQVTSGSSEGKQGLLNRVVGSL